MHQLGPLDILMTVAFLAAALVVERLARGHLHWLEDAMWPLKNMLLQDHPGPPKGIQEDDDVRWNWGAKP